MICLISVTIANGQVKPQIASFRLQDVRLLDSPFKQAEEINQQYLLEMDADRLLAPFLREAGLPAKELYQLGKQRPRRTYRRPLSLRSLLDGCIDR